MRRFHNEEVTCPNCGYVFDTDDATDAKPDYTTDPATTRTDGSDPDNDENQNSNNMPTNKLTPQDILTQALVAAAQNFEPAAKPASKTAQPMRNQTLSDMLVKAMAEARAKLIGRK